MPRRIRVCQILNRFVVGGAEMVALDVASGLDPDRFESLVVAVLETTADGEPEMRRRFREAGVATHALRRRSFRDPRAIIDLFRCFRRLRPDIVHGHQRFSDLWACRVGRWAGVPRCIWTRHSVYRDMNSRQIHRYRSLAARTPLVLAVSDAVRRNCIEVEGLSPERVHTIVNGIDVERFRPRPGPERAAMRAVLGVADAEFLILFVGRLSLEKAPEAFPRLVAGLRERGLPVRGFVCGAGPQEELVRAAARGAPVSLLGVRNDVPELLAASDLLVSTSRIEGLPLNIMEAMAAGTAFVGPDLDQVLQLVAGEPDLEAGVYRQPPAHGDVSATLIDEWVGVAAGRLVDDEGRRRAGARGRAVIVQRFSRERMIQAHEQVYAELAASTR